MTFTESIVEDAALAWFEELGYAVAPGPHLAPGEPATERVSFSDVVLLGRLRQAIRRLNPAIHFPNRHLEGENGKGEECQDAVGGVEELRRMAAARVWAEQGLGRKTMFRAARSSWPTNSAL